MKEIKTSIGGIALAVSVGDQKPEQADSLLSKTLAWLCAHDCASKAFAKKSPFKRDDKYSAEKATHVEKACKTVYETYFNDVAIVASEYVETVSEAVQKEREKRDAAVAALRKSGVPDDVIWLAYPELKPVESTPEASTPPPAEQGGGIG